MTPEQFAETLKLLGVSAPLVAVLFYLLRQANEERRDVVTRFLSALETTIRTNAEGAVKTSEALMTITTTIREMGAQGAAEHRAILEALAMVRRHDETKGDR